MYKVYSFLISLYPPRAPRRKKRCANREVKGVKGVKTTAFVDLKTLSPLEKVNFTKTYS